VQPLEDAEVRARLAGTAGWRRRGNAIAAAWRFADFRAAFAFMADVAAAAEELQHHPDWRNRHALVEIELWTHDAGGLTERDFALAQRADAAAARHGGIRADRGARRAFVSHCWEDKSVARRVARRLAHRGVAVWLDEDEMQLGDRLSERIEREIAASSHVIVLWSARAARSTWVRREVEFARGMSKPPILIPAWLEHGLDAALPGQADALLHEEFGLSLADPIAFEREIERLAHAILGEAADERRGREPLRRDLRALGREASDLQSLIEQLSEHGRITHAQLAAAHVTMNRRHEAETALIALHEYLDGDADGRYVVSLVAAQFFVRYGIGHAVLERQLRREPAHSTNLGVMFGGLGERCADRAFVPPVLALFERAGPGQDQHLASFVRNNFDQLGEEQRKRVVALATTPVRGPAGFTPDLAYELYRRLPDDRALQQLWWWWIQEYEFGGKPDVESRGDAGQFFAMMNEAHREGLAHFVPLMEHFETCFRRRVASGDRRDIDAAVGILVMAHWRRYHRLPGLLAAIESRRGSAEWEPLRRERPLYLDALDDVLRGFAAGELPRHALSDLRVHGGA
jgi:4a-hydroxytetrahydrobiopterin dehydratase